MTENEIAKIIVGPASPKIVAALPRQLTASHNASLGDVIEIMSRFAEVFPDRKSVNALRAQRLLWDGFSRFPFAWAIRMIFNAKAQRRKGAREEETNSEAYCSQELAAIIKTPSPLLSLCVFAPLRLCVEFWLRVCSLTLCLPADVAFRKGGFA